MDALLQQLQRALSDRYDVDREIGGGGMSRVFHAVERELGREVVIKVLAPELASAVSAERFRREIQVGAQLHHPHIVPLLTAGETGDILFYTMPFVRGDTLRALLARDGRMSIDGAARVLRDVAAALAHAHRAGIVHRDIKPDNIFLVDGEAQVADFGVAKAISAASRTTTLTGIGIALGTPAYMAPEQVTGADDIDHRADLYSLGVVAYETLAGRRPFVDRSPQSLMAAHITTAPDPLEQHRPDVPELLRDLVMAMLAKEPSGRPRDAQVIVQATGDLSIGTTRPLPLPRIHARRRRWLAPVGTLVVLAAAAVIAAPPWLRSSAESEARARAVAVLPLRNISGDSADEYFADGMTEELINAVSRIEGVRVSARTSAFAFKDRNTDVRDVARQLGVSYVVEGSVRRAGQRLRVTARLLDARNGYQLWSADYNRAMSDVFAVQDDIARAVAQELGSRIGSTASDAGAKSGAAADSLQLEAYDNYLKGRYAWNARTRASLLQAERYFRRVVAMDPTFAAGWGGLAEVYVVMPFFGAMAPDSAWSRTRSAASRALALDSTRVEAYTALAYGISNYAREYEQGEAYFKRALAINTNYVPARQWFAEYLFSRARFDESQRMMVEALRLDPLSRILVTVYGRSLIATRGYRRADSLLRDLITLDPAFAVGHLWSSALHLSRDDARAALVAAERTLDLAPGLWMAEAMRGCALARSGARERALQVNRELLRRMRSEYIPPSTFGMLYTCLDDRDEALRWLHRSFDELDPNLAENVIFMPFMDPLRTHPEYARLMRRMEIADVKLGRAPPDR
ncbi:MAG: protein kinase [Gemmatimonadaceae bacterium]